MSVTLKLHDPLLAGNKPIGDYTPIFRRTWRRSIARRCGFKIGTVELTGADLTASEMGEFFRFGLMREIRESGGARVSWQGIVTRLQWTHQGDVFTTDLTTMYNARRALYRRLFDNLLTNGSAESGAWAAWNGATVTQSTEWVSDGTYSCKIVVADSVVRGCFLQTSIPIVDGVAYSFSGSTNILSGGMRIDARRQDNNQLLAGFSSGGQLGNVVATFTIPADNTYAGLIYLIAVNIHTMGASTFYIDGAIFKQADAPADTGWSEDARSRAVYGRRESIELWGGMSNAAANAHVASDLSLSAWPQPDVPPQNVTRAAAIDPREDKLTIAFAGYWATLNWIYTRSTGSGQASALVRTLAGYQPAYIQVGNISLNPLNFTIEDSTPLRVGDVLKEICDSGDAGGGKWAIGVYADRKLEYKPVAAELSYHLRGGHLLQIAGGDTEPWLARPGWANVDDMPVGPGPLSGQARNNARWRYLEEVEMMPPDATHKKNWLSYNREETA